MVFIQTRVKPNLIDLVPQFGHTQHRPNMINQAPNFGASNVQYLDEKLSLLQVPNPRVSNIQVSNHEREESVPIVHSSQRRTRKECVYRNRTKDKKVVRGICSPKPEKWIDLPQAIVPESLKSLVSDSQDISKSYPVLNEELTPDNYHKKFQLLLWIEEIERQIDFRQYDIDKAILTKHDDGLLAMKVPGLAECRPSLKVGDKVRLERKDEANIYEGLIQKVELDQILASFNSTFYEQYDEKLYDAMFYESRGQLRNWHHAVSEVKKLPSSVLFPRKKIRSKPPCVDITKPSLKWFNSSLNQRQKTAVINILKSECRPSPYVLFGPPGTGKTVTLVECILQVLNNVPHSRILVCGVSNTCTDTMAMKLIESDGVDSSNMVRVIARSRVGKIFDHLTGYTVTPDGDWIKKRIIVSTCANVVHIAARAEREGLKFTHTFIDEAAQAMEPECLLPIMLSAQNTGCTVIAGDPYQLGPVIRGKNIGENGLSVTLMERLCAMAPYQKHENFREFGFYDPRIITMFVESHRCCMELIEVNSELFYESQLICHPTLDQPLLKKLSLEFPIQFVHIAGEDEQEDGSPSWFNESEARVCIDKLRWLYSFGLKSDEIGIITPYKGQISKIKSLLQTDEITPCKVATIEEFQGGERRVIILSMVRSSITNMDYDKKFGLGFIFNDKRFNVATSRAQSLLIAIGDSRILRKDPIWKFFIENARMRNALQPSGVRNFLQPPTKLRKKTSRKRAPQAGKRRTNVNALLATPVKRVPAIHVSMPAEPRRSTLSVFAPVQSLRKVSSSIRRVLKDSVPWKRRKRKSYSARQKRRRRNKISEFSSLLQVLYKSIGAILILIALYAIKLKWYTVSNK